MTRILFSCAAAAILATTSAAAQHDIPGTPHAVATVTISQPVTADGTPLAPGKYEVRILDERPTVNGTSSETQRIVEFVQNGKTIARDVAEVFATAGPSASASAAVGTSGPATQRAVVQTLKGGEFVRIVITDAANRFLIHLPTEQFSQPEPRPEPPARIELPPQLGR